MQDIASWIYIALFGVMLFLIIRPQKTPTKAKILEGQEKALKLAEENIALNREQNQLLKDILNALEKR